MVSTVAGAALAERSGNRMMRNEIMLCETCGNDYAKGFRVIDHRGVEHRFDSIECAAQVIAPECGHCSCRVLGHGVEQAGIIYCCQHCANAVATKRQ